MIARIRKSMQEKDQGFTLIELLVVMIIIGILAAIAIPVFLNQRKKANDTAATSDVSTLGKEIATYYVDAKDPIAAGAFGVGSTDSKWSIGTGTTAIADMGVKSGPVSGATLSYTGTGGATIANAAVNWCVTLTYTGGTRTTVFYSAAKGLNKESC
ncbi:prepilin-type N-terminal cleavage/methylation domain-containing protein [Cellulomonas cellasea]|uniref:Prepilin-type N-terminal cleavage/methylation domain-containing protein n=1 Tax=Cellulomonas cellasea DSM 20118 TaxID=1408250 RepID=A0A0A0BAP3_9CELL|nr:prepilin-type N-terminal cleavage/methylation domain-containing protein [Cellulomonas cellasea]KGM02909.1 hypothetical protein Q760_10815 [Cellulomonas cellasea DSM 20118]